MTTRRADLSAADALPRRPAMLVTLAVGVLICACSGNSGTSAGVLKGTASPCIRPSTYNTSHAWTIKVILRRGSTVISTKTVLDTQAAGQPVTTQIFTFTEPPGTYSISGPTPKEQPVTIKADTTSTVELAGACKQ
jgi:hypothetical protein